MKLIKFVYPHCGLYFFAQKTKNYTYINETLYNSEIICLLEKNYCELFCNEKFEK